MGVVVIPVPLALVYDDATFSHGRGELLKAPLKAERFWGQQTLSLRFAIPSSWRLQEEAPPPRALRGSYMPPSLLLAIRVRRSWLASNYRNRLL